MSITGKIFELLNKTCVGYVKKSHEALDKPTVPTEHAASITYDDIGATRFKELLLLLLFIDEGKDEANKASL